MNEILINILIIVFAILAYFLCIGLYFKLKKNKIGKFSIEIEVIAVAILISTLFKTIIFMQNNGVLITDVNGMIRCIISAFFSAIGGLQFEGLPLLDGDFTSVVSSNLITAYYVSSLWSGLVFLTIFSFAISVEFANACKLRITLFFQKLFKIKRNIYVFTSITEDVLTLANSIEKHHNDNNEKCLIIFSGDIGAFDKLNPLCSKIFSNGYIYHSLNLTNNTKTILELLKVSEFDNVSLFAFSLNEDIVADDQKNAEVIFSETNRIMDQLLMKLINDDLFKIIYNEVITSSNFRGNNAVSNDKLKIMINKYIKNTINFYVLTKNETNIRAFDLGLKDDLFKKIKIMCPGYENITATLWQYLSTKIQIIPINEADLAAKDFTKKRIAKMKEKNLFEFNNVSNDVYKVLSLGFGEKGQAVMSKLYETSTIVDYDGNILPFYANIFDEKIDNVSGTFMATHPMFVSIEANKYKPCEVNEIIKNKIIQIYGAENEEMLHQNTIPVIKFNKQMCLSNEFFKYIDECSGIANEACTYDAIIIALGNDAYNLKLANSMIRDIANEYDKFNINGNVSDIGKTFQFIGVNIRNKNNLKQLENDIVNSCIYKNGEQIKGKTFEVITFGDAEEMYTYNNIIGINEAKENAYRYNILRNYFEKIINSNHNLEGEKVLIKNYRSDNSNNYLKNYCNTYCQEENITLLEVINLLNKNVNDIKYNEKRHEIDEYWLTVSIYDKRSSEAAFIFKEIYEKYLEPFLEEKFSNEKIFKKFELASKLEHERWTRFQIANGFKYSKNHQKELKKHERIIVYEELQGRFSINDAYNVAMAFMKKEQ